jgi:hypothetical protein
MRSYPPLTGAAVLLALAGPALAQPKDPAELFPAQTLAYAEVRQPDKLSRELASLIKGSALEDLAAVFAKARTERGDMPEEGFSASMVFAPMGMFFSPEALAEFGRMGGGAVALTGWSKEDGPEVVGVIYPGECNLIMMYLRTYLAADSDVRIAEKVEGVNLYRERGRDYRVAAPNPPGGGGAPPPAPPIRDKGPTIALMPGLAIIASTPKAAREAVRRAKGKVSDPSLASVGAFKRNAAQRDKAGVFAYADVGALTAQVDAAPTERKGHSDWDAFKALCNPRGMGIAVASLTLQNGNLDGRVQVEVDAKQPSPLFDLLSDKKTALDGLHFAPKDGLLSVTLPWTDGAKRWEQVVALLDNVARADGVPPDRLPSKDLAGAEQAAGIKLGPDLFARVAGFTLTVDLRSERTVNHMPLQLAITAKDEDAAKALDELMPKLLSLAGRPVVAPEAEKTVRGVVLRTFSAESVPWREELSYGRAGKTLVLGPTKQGVAAALADGAKGGGLLGEANVAAALKDTGDAQAVAAWSIPETLMALLMMHSGPGQGRAVPSGGPPGGSGGAAPPAAKDKEGGEEKLVKELRQAVEPLHPAVVTLTRKGDLVVLEARQAGLKTVSARAINVLIDAAVRQSMAPRGGVDVRTIPDLPDKP